jgi:hypothetical protein
MSSSPFKRAVDLIRQKVQVVEVPPSRPVYREVPGGCHYVVPRWERRARRKNWEGSTTYPPLRPTGSIGEPRTGEQTPSLGRWR